MYITTIPNRNSPPAVLLREGYREGGKVKNRTLANLSMLPPRAIEAIRRVLNGDQIVSTDELFEIVEDGSRAHGNAEAVMTAMKKLDKVHKMINQGQLHGKDEIGVRVGKVVNKYKVSKHFTLHIEDDTFDFEIDQEKVDAEAALDGIYVVRTSVKKHVMDTEQTVLGYKQLSNVERAFRCLKSVDLMVRPIWHNLEERVRAHIFLCMLAYYVQWHMIEAWRPLLFADEDQVAKASRDPVAPAKRSKGALEKAATKQLEDGSTVHSFRTLLKHLGEIVRNKCCCPNTESDTGDEAYTFYKTTTPNPKQRKALNLLSDITV